ncbi:hypothetical protein DPMN_014061 [Dreissena polymorpha]|uniref:Uncharacterized protein n=1 Tax=Dreissena polymorpha TaxID=45954 RepID=A0A9D4S2C9_DREPO|nr:hypothetical protein DPMN_014061 [Dreissena polymorpha]
MQGDEEIVWYTRQKKDGRSGTANLPVLRTNGEDQVWAIPEQRGGSLMEGTRGGGT